MAPKVTTSSHLKEDVSDKRGLDRVVPNGSKAPSSRADARSGGKLVPSALPIPTRSLMSTFKNHSGVVVHEVPLKTPPLRLIVRILDPRGEMSAHFPGQS